MRTQQYQLDVEPAPLKNGPGSKPVRPRFREATFEDYPQIAALESRYGLLPKNYEEWKHLWTQNPLWCRFKQWPIGWVCENEHDEIVGSIGNIPLQYEFDHRPVVVATSRGLVVDEGYRPYCFPLLASFFGQSNVDLFLNTTVNDKADKLQELFHASRVPAGTWNRSAFWITNYRGFTASLLASKGVRGSRALSYPGSAGLFIRDTFSGKSLRIQHDGLETQFCAEFDDRFDRLWERIRNSASRRLLAVRTCEVLQWHFQQALTANRAWVVTVNGGPGLSGYGIFCREDNPATGLKRVRLVDFQCLDGHTYLLRPILFRGLERCQNECIHMLEVIGFSSHKQRIIEGIAPNYRELSSWRYFYKASKPYLAAGLADAKVWDPTCFDGDSSL